ncbi:MAG: hypothetical protein AB1791_12785 [Chloroflexota bacterium]
MVDLMSLDPRLFRRRYRKAAEPLLENSTLRDALTDEQGQQLLDWGLGQVKQAVADTLSVDAGEIEAVLEERTAAIGRVMRAVNRLVGGLDAAADEEWPPLWQQLSDGLQQWRGHGLAPAVLEAMTASRPNLAQASLFAHLIALIQSSPDEEE